MEYVRQDHVTWAPGVREAMRDGGIDSQTIDLLGREGFTTFSIIHSMDDASILTTLDKFHIPAAQLAALLTLKHKGKKVEASKHTPTTSGTHCHGNKLIDLHKHRGELCELIAAGDVIHKLHIRDIITQTQARHCLLGQTEASQVHRLLTVIECKGHRALVHLYRALVETNQGKAAQLLLDTCMYTTYVYILLMVIVCIQTL